jgi:hypothetical protein
MRSKPMDQEAKDRVADFVHEQIERYARGDAELCRGGRPEEKLAEEFNGLSREEQRFALMLLDRQIAYEDEQELAA